ncbi:hypothetical protein C900_02579 [Fulvivirga imtechensis AK7]|uniref:DUF697 domain-containing protein n=1 Tax=Fulvivirga imtechensis AK7 TaxID=1237149 RepID=L8JRB3_9BACT|nr:DUF697 domain-containing protein [Fulvivirga imtechensis]ELR71516.1 hypothetical protein C900_02579 [Fulvivirga imtechensis AK7]
MKTLKKIGIFVSLALILGFVLFAVNQIISFHANLTTVNETLAWLITGFISVTVCLLLLIPFVLIARLPKSVTFPDNYEEEAQYHAVLKYRLSRNRLVKKAGLDIATEEGMKQALELLNREAHTVIKQTAKSVFLTTAISQNGKLDALTVFITQSRMIWRVAHIYWQRPSIRDMIKLYGNVGATALIASELDEIDITRQVEPIINAVLRSPGRSIPVIGHAAHIITDSLLEGSTNAFLTLRVGIVTQRYCGSWDIADRKTIRKNSFITASGLLKNLVLESSGKVVTSVMSAIKNAGKNTLKSGVRGVTGIFKRNKGSEAIDPSA